MKYDIPAPTFTYYLSQDEDGVWQATSVPCGVNFEMFQGTFNEAQAEADTRNSNFYCMESDDLGDEKCKVQCPYCSMV
jgi:hypothetical protein